MNTTVLSELLDLLEIIVRRKAIILELHPDKILSQSQLAKKTGILPSNLSKYLSELKDKEIVEVRQSKNKEGFSINLVKLKLRTNEILNEASSLLTSKGKIPIPDLNDFNMILERLMNPEIQEYAADSIQLASLRFIIPYDSGFFSFLEKHMDDEEIRPALVILMKAAQEIVGEWSPEERETVLVRLGSRLQSLTEKGSKAVKKETMNLFKALGAYDISYTELKDLYLNQMHSGNNPALFRSLLLESHRDKIMDLWLSMIDQYESATESEKQWIDQEFTQLR